MSQFKIRPLADRLVVRQNKADEKSPGGIYIPENAKEKPTEGEVLAVGPGRVLDNGETVPVAVSVGDRILYGKYAGQPVTLDGEEYVMLRETDVIGVLGA